MTRRGGPAESSKKVKLLDQVRLALRVSHYSQRTEEAYVRWIRRFVLFHGRQHPAGMGEQEVAQFLSHLAREGKVSASTQSQAASAIIFLYKKVLRRRIDRADGVFMIVGPMVAFEKLRVPAWLEIHEPEAEPIRFEIDSAVAVNAPPKAFSRTWLTTPVEPEARGGAAASPGALDSGESP